MGVIGRSMAELTADAINEEVRVRLYRLEWTQRALARAIGMREPNLNRKLNNRVPWKIPQLLRVAYAFGVNLSDLLYGAETRVQEALTRSQT